MKYAILHTRTILKECIVGIVQITNNVLNFFKSTTTSIFSIYQIEEEAGEGAFGGKIVGEKLYLSNGKIYGIKEISKHSDKFAIFEPDSNFKNLGTGWVRKTNLNSNALREHSAGAILLSSEKEFPADWRVAVLDVSTSSVDYGELVPVQILKSMEK
jgi:hypothetical protein